MTAGAADPRAGAWMPDGTDLAHLFSICRGYDRLVLAVSGGSDSMALMHLAARWLAVCDSPQPILEVATVDHGLRPQSRAEAETVAAAAASLGLKHHLLEWHKAAGASFSQLTAREARYRLLHDVAAERGPVRSGVVTAHTQDDQAETLLMRLARGSGPDGLRAMRAVRPLQPGSGVTLLRPLLGVTRAGLRAVLTANGVAWIDDPSNEDVRFERVRLRRAGPALTAIGLTPAKLELAALRQARAADALHWAATELERTCLTWHDGAFAVLDGEVFSTAPEDLRIRLLARLLSVLRGGSEPAELSQVERLAADLKFHGQLRMTLGGCEIRACARQIRIFREAGRADLSPKALPSGAACVWDQRFLIARPPATKAHRSMADPEGPADFDVKPVSAADLRALRKADPRWRRIPARAAATLPAVWSGARLVGVGGMMRGAPRLARCMAGSMSDGAARDEEPRGEASREITITPIWRGEILLETTETRMPGDGAAELA